MARVLRGEIRWADPSATRGHEQAGRRPVVVLSHDVFNERSGNRDRDGDHESTSARRFSADLEIDDVRMPKQSWVKISQVRTLSIERLGRRLGRLSPEALDQLVEGLNEIVA